MSASPKRIVDIAAYTNAVVYTYPCGCMIRFRYGYPVFESTEHIRTCGGAVAIRKFEEGGRVKIWRGGDLCEEAMMHCARDIKKRLDRHQPDQIIRREWYTT